MRSAHGAATVPLRPASIRGPRRDRPCRHGETPLPSTVRRIARATAPLLLALVAVACTTAGADPIGTPTPTGTPTETAAPQADPITVDLSPGGAAVPLENGWTVQHCEGDAPFLCVRDADGDVLGTVEYGSYPASDAIARAVAEGTVAEALEAMAREQHTAIEADRARGCGSGYEYQPEPVQPTTIGGEPAAVYAFSGVVDGREIERHRSYYTVHRGQLWILSAPASDPDGCMATDLGEFTPADLAIFEPYLERIVAGSRLPDAGRALIDGIVVGVDGGLEGGLLYLLWQGAKERIQQPVALTQADVEQRQLHREPAVAQLTVVDHEAGSSFVVVPPDGPDARLHLIVDGLIREVLVQHVTPAALEAVPDAGGHLLGRVRPAASAAG